MNSSRLNTSSNSSGFAVALIGVWLGVLAPSAIAQRAANEPTLTPVEQGVADRGPLAVSRRVAPADLRVPQDFERVYRIDSPSRRKAMGDLFARRSGAITAVFPRSQYVETRFGSLAEVPAGTTYYIGTDAAARAVGDDSLPPGVWRPTDPAPRRAVDRRAMDTSIDLSARQARPIQSDVVTYAEDGAPSSATADRAGAGQTRDRAKTRADSRADGVHRTGAPSDGADESADPRPREPLFRREPVERPTIFRSEEFRARRLSDLMDRARDESRDASDRASRTSPGAKSLPRDANTDKIRESESIRR
jgi:hypothetical protein